MLNALQIISIFFLLSLSAFFSGSETAIFSLSSLTRRKLINRSEKFLVLQEPHTLLPALLFGNTLVNISISYIVTARITRILGILYPTGILITTLVVAFVILCFGEFTPKFAATRFAEFFTIKGLPLLLFLKKVFTPFSFLIDFGTTRFWRREEKKLTLKEVKVMINLAREEGHVTDREQKFVESVLSLKEIAAEDAMTPRKEIQAFPEMTTIASIVKKRPHSRIPLYGDGVDDIKGILYIKDVLPYLRREHLGNIEGRKLKRPAMFIPSSTRLSELLGLFQKRQTHIAICVDEYGGVDGLITLDDILKRIV